MRIFYQSALKAHSRLLDVTARRLLEKPIHELLAEEMSARGAPRNTPSAGFTQGFKP